MKNTAIAFVLALTSIAATAQTYVAPHFRSNGSLVEGHYRGSPNSGLNGTGSSTNSTYVQPHVTNQGNLIQGHYRTTPDSTTLNNFNTSGNINPYTGTVGTRSACTSLYCR